MQIIFKINQDINNNTLLPSKKPLSYGFTLIEMSITLAIIALLVGGIMAGKSMIDNSKLRSVAINANIYMQAMEKFRNKYNALAGDMISATQIWGRADGNAAVSSNCASPATDISLILPHATCNGNGDGFIAVNTAENYEIFRAWQQLKNEGLITGNLNGAAGASGSSQAIVGTNIPASEFRKFGFDIKYIPDTAIPVDYFSVVSYGHLLHFGEEVAGNNLAHGVALSSRSGAELDKKFDDNIPSTGKILSKNVATCVTSATAYNLAQTDGKQCTMIFKADF